MPARSLRRHFTAWLAAGAGAVVLVAVALELSVRIDQLGALQDARLLAAAQAGRERPAGVAAWRVSQPSGDRIAGDVALPAYPWREEVRAGEAPRLYYTQVGGTLLRAAAVLRAETGASPVLVQVAEPASARWPGAAAWRAGAALPFAAGVLVMAAIAGGAAWRAREWLRRSVHAFADPAAAMGPPPPAEIAPALDQLRQLQGEQAHWVEEQRRFLADAAHQLRTPMAVLRAQLQAALAAGDDPRPQLQAMLHTVDRATGLANQLLSLTRLEQLQRAGGLAEVAVGDAVRDAVIELAPLVAGKRLDFALEGDGFAAPAEPVMLGEVLRNLLANAIHHSPRGSRLGVVLRGAAPLREVVVWDEGPGIDDALRPRLFTPYAAAKGGVGLGLSICQQIAAVMQAEVRLHNRVEDGRVVGVDAVLAWREERRA